MVMSRIFTIMVFISILSALFQGKGSALAAAIAEGAQSGITLALSLGGSLCLWSGIGKLMEHAVRQQRRGYIYCRLCGWYKCRLNKRKRNW